MQTRFTVLGVHDGHNATACLLRNGRVVASVSEERLSNLKNEAGYPRRAIEEVLRIGKCPPAEIDLVALGTKFMHHHEFFLNWDWYRKGYSDQLNEMKKEQERRAHFLEERLAERKNTIVGHLGVPEGRITVVDHHECHAATAFYGSPWVRDKGQVLVLTLDGSGDGICSTVNIGEGGDLERIAETKSDASLGKVYSRVTFLLGMKPWEHEYKLMGLAPYADKDGVEKSYEVMRSLVEIDDHSLVFRTGTQLWTNYCYSYLNSSLENHRFDWVAGAVQRVTEELVVKWVRNAIAATGIPRVACAGGVFMNVKVNMLLSELEELDDIFVFPSCGDESICFGAAFKVYADHLRQNNQDVDMPRFDSNYLGPDFSHDDIGACIESNMLGKKYFVREFEDINDIALKLLLSGEIVARFDGRMEYGARALGNRSILMDARNTDKIRELNAAIKQRDFWMPFASTILQKHQHQYIINPKDINAPYMILAFHTRGRAHKELAAAIHPYDLTVRPQVLDEGMNPKYHDLLERFESATGVGGVLNTSYNLHGEPIVCNPQNAIATFEKSGLRNLVLGNFLISKNRYDRL